MRRNVYSMKRGRGDARHWLRLICNGTVLVEIECDKGSHTENSLKQLVADANGGETLAWVNRAKWAIEEARKALSSPT